MVAEISSETFNAKSGPKKWSIKRKFKVPKVFTPTMDSHLDKEETIRYFIGLQDTFIAKMKVKENSPVAFSCHFPFSFFLCENDPPNTRKTLKKNLCNKCNLWFPLFLFLTPV